MNAIKGALARHPVLFNSVVGYTVFASGDVMAQRLDMTSEAGASAEWKWDHKRSLSIGLLGIVQNGFLLRIWYRTLDKFVTPKVRCCVVVFFFFRCLLVWCDVVCVFSGWVGACGRGAWFLSLRCCGSCTQGSWTYSIC